jgi:uncharacterized protein (TIGR00369 family)
VTEDLAAKFRGVPVNAHLGFELREMGAVGAGTTDAGAVVAFTPRPEHAQEYGVVHGGILSALADTTAVYAVQPTLAAGEGMTSIEFKVNFLAAARPERGEVVARSTMLRRGRTVCVVRSDVWQGDTHVLTGLFTYVVLAGRG